jgi:hypothetical protein
MKTDTEDPKGELCEFAAGFLGSSSGTFVDELFKTFRGNAVAVQRVLVSAKTADYPAAYINKVIAGEKALLNRDALDQAQIDNWKPVRGQYPPIDYTHPRQPYFIRSNIDKKLLYLDAERVEKLVNAERDRLGMS